MKIADELNKMYEAKVSKMMKKLQADLRANAVKPQGEGQTRIEWNVKDDKQGKQVEKQMRKELNDWLKKNDLYDEADFIQVGFDNGDEYVGGWVDFPKESKFWK